MTMQMLTNPLNAFYAGTTSDYRTGVDSNGELLPLGGIYLPFRANATITAGQALSFVVPTATVPLSVKPRAASAGDLIALFAGVAITGAAAGAPVTVCVFGHCLAAVFSSTTVVIGQAAILDVTNAGVLQSSSTDVVAADLNGSLAGTWLGIKNAANIADLWLQVR